MRLFVPSAVTLLAVLCALLAILWAPVHPYWACVSIIAASIFDMLDGRIARMLDAQTELGAQLDSLADVTAFGVAPAMIGYHALAPLHPVALGIDLALLFCFAFTASAALRLARFNIAPSAAGPGLFRGIPTPVGALMVATTVMVPIELERVEIALFPMGHPALLITVLVLATVLMVAPIGFPSFKSFRSKIWQTIYFSSMAGGVLMLILGLPGGVVLFVLLALYLVRGLVTAALR